MTEPLNRGPISNFARRAAAAEAQRRAEREKRQAEEDVTLSVLFPSERNSVTESNDKTQRISGLGQPALLTSAPSISSSQGRAGTEDETYVGPADIFARQEDDFSREMELLGESVPKEDCGQNQKSRNRPRRRRFTLKKAPRKKRSAGESSQRVDGTTSGDGGHDDQNVNETPPASQNAPEPAVEQPIQKENVSVVPSVVLPPTKKANLPPKPVPPRAPSRPRNRAAAAAQPPGLNDALKKPCDCAICGNEQAVAAEGWQYRNMTHTLFMHKDLYIYLFAVYRSHIEENATDAEMERRIAPLLANFGISMQQRCEAFVVPFSSVPSRFGNYKTRNWPVVCPNVDLMLHSVFVYKIMRAELDLIPIATAFYRDVVLRSLPFIHEVRARRVLYSEAPDTLRSVEHEYFAQLSTSPAINLFVTTNHTNNEQLERCRRFQTLQASPGSHYCLKHSNDIVRLIESIKSAEDPSLEHTEFRVCAALRRYGSDRSYVDYLWPNRLGFTMSDMPNANAPTPFSAIHDHHMTRLEHFSGSPARSPFAGHHSLLHPNLFSERHVNEFGSDTHDGFFRNPVDPF